MHYHAPGETMAYTMRDMTVSASYSKIYNISFDPNGGSGTMSSVKICQGDTFTFPRCKFTPPANKEFDCWLTPIGDKETYAVGETVVFPGETNICLTARWKYKKYTVEFDTDDVCTPPPSQSVTYGEYAEDHGDPVADGYNFAGWYYDSEYSRPFSFYNRITENTTLYAKWEEINGSGYFDYRYSGYVEENVKNMKVYYGDDLIFTSEYTSATNYTYYMLVNGDTYSLTYTDGYHPFVIDDSTQVRRKVNGEWQYFNAKDFIKPGNTVVIYSMAVSSRRLFTANYKLEILYHPGDVDGNGKVNDADAKMLLKHISGIETITDSNAVARAEMNNDGKRDILDVIAICE